MESAYEWLVRREDELFLLFTPPFDRSLHNPGYIKGYPPGIRENGGQYTHAATWGVWAFAELGRGELAAELFDMLNPVTHGDTPEKIQNYQVEPYVVAADIYSVPPHVGHGGWTWYTGSSGWLYRLGLEGVLGLRRVGGDGLRLEPHVPGEWEEYAITYRHGSARYRIRVENPRGVEGGVKEVYLDGERLEGDLIPLQDDGGEHQVRVVLGTQINADTENQR
jgi:cyclic beta-1,2-glucan synthetase